MAGTRANPKRKPIPRGAVRVSGVYLIKHRTAHQPVKPTLLLRGTPLPRCLLCGKLEVSLYKAAPFIDEALATLGGVFEEPRRAA